MLLHLESIANFFNFFLDISPLDLKKDRLQDKIKPFRHTNKTEISRSLTEQLLILYVNMRRDSSTSHARPSHTVLSCIYLHPLKPPYLPLPFFLPPFPFPLQAKPHTKERLGTRPCSINIDEKPSFYARTYLRFKPQPTETEMYRNRNTTQHQIE